MSNPNPSPETRFKPGSPGGPGRPKGKTIKEMVREWLDEHPDDMAAFVEHFVKDNKELAWQMMEGRPPQDITSKGERLIPVPLDNVYKNEDVQEDKDDAEKN